MDTGPRIEAYEWAGGREAMLRFGPEDGPVVVLVLPLFEEANRTRAFGVAILRALAARGVAGALPDLPGQGESLVPTEHATLADMRAAFAACARDGAYGVAIRSGALLDAEARLGARWLLAPQSGASVLRELARVTGHALGAQSQTIAGNVLSNVLLEGLATADAAASDIATRVVRLSSDQRPADLHIVGAPIWRRAEPDNDPELVEALTADIAGWIATCEG